jgi:hypothetical protein
MSLLLFLLCAPLFPGAVFANTPPLSSGTVVVHPAKAEVVMLPGEEKKIMINIGNGTPAPLRVEAFFEDVAPNPQLSAIDDPVKLLGSARSISSLKDLLSIPNTSFDVLTGKEVAVPITIRIPKDAEPGGRYGSVVFRFSPLAQSGATGANVALESRIAALLYVRISGEVREEGKLVAFGLFNKAKTTLSPTPSLPLRMQVAYENTGAVHVNPYGQITLRSMSGKTSVLLIDPWAVLPGATRMREIDMTEALTPGYYTAHLELNRGYKDIIDEQEVGFWVLPSKTQSFIGIIFLLILILIIRKSLRLSRHST